MGLVVSSTAATTSSTPRMFTNPIVVPGADPWVVFQGGWYWFTATAGDRIDIRKSRTLAGLGQATPVTIWRTPVTGPRPGA